MLERGQAVPDRKQVRQRLRVGQRYARLRVAQPVVERLGTEQKRERKRDCTELVARDMGNRGLGPLRKDDGDLVVATHTQPAQRVGQPVGLVLQFPEGVPRRGAGLVFPVQRDPFMVGCMPPADRMRDVEVRGNLPAEGVADLAVAVGLHPPREVRTRRQPRLGLRD